MFKAMDRRLSKHKKSVKREILMKDLKSTREERIRLENETKILKKKSEEEINTLALAAAAWAELEQMELLSDVPFIKACEGCENCGGCKECYTVEFYKIDQKTNPSE